jgi:DNA-binding IclR family transcriptional regulator
MRNLALPLMRELRDDIGEAVNLIIPDGKEAMYIEKVDTLQPVRVYTRIGRRAPLYAGACPRILLAFLPIDMQTQYLSETKLLPIASGTITDLAELEQILDDSRRYGFSVSHHELEDGTSAVAAPVFDFTGQVIAGLSVAGPASRFQDEHLPDLIQKVKHFANQLSAQMGWNGGVSIRNA